MSEQVRKRVRRPPAMATWEYEHRWGTQIGDSTTLRVIRTDGGDLAITYGSVSVDVRAALVGPLAEMIAAAAEWTDTPPDSSAQPDEGES